MTDFIITGPDGKRYKVTGDSAEGAVAAVKKLLGMSSSTVEPMPSAMAQRAAAARDGTLKASPQSLARAEEMDRIAEDEIILSRNPAAFNMATKAVQGLPFIGEYMDEAMGAASGAIGGDAEFATRTMRDTQGAMDRQRPGTSFAAGMTGGIVGSIPMAAAAAPALISAAPPALAGRVIGGAAIGAATGATEGAISGYGAGNDGDRARSAMERGIIGGAFGGAAGAALPAISAGVKSIAETIKGRDVGVISRVLGISPGAAKVVKKYVENDDLAAAQALLRRSGADAMLADAGPNTAQLLDSAVQAGGAAPRIARGAVESRAARAGQTLSRTLDTVLGPPAGVREGARGIAQRTSAIRQQAYTRAYSAPIDYAADAGRKIEDVLGRVPPRTLSAAISEANDAMRAEGVRNMQIMAEIADDGAVTFRQMPNVQQLDELKKALGSIARNETDAITGRISGAGLRAKKLAGQLSEAIADAVPSYRTAVKLGGDKIAEDQAFDLGRRLLSTGTTREQASEVLDGASREAKAAAKQGLRSYIDDTLANVQRTITDPNTDAREAMTAIKSLSSRANQQKLRMLLGNQADKVLDQIDEAAAHLELRSAIARNSATASRIAGKQAMDEITEPSALGELLSGRPAEASKKVVQFFTGQTGEARVEQQQQIYAEIADALTKLRGPDAEAALRSVEKAIAGQPVNSAEAARIGRVLASGGALGIYQTGTQSQSRQ
jgi:hypothetical protein